MAEQRAVQQRIKGAYASLAVAYGTMAAAGDVVAMSADELEAERRAWQVVNAQVCRAHDTLRECHATLIAMLPPGGAGAD